MRTGIGFVIWLALVAAASASDYALIIGVNHCPRFVLPDGSKPRPLRAAEADADAMADLVVDKFRFPAANVVVLKGEQATLAALRASFRDWNQKLKPSDRFIFYFSGHGTQIADQKPFDEEDDLDEALCVYDAESSGNKLLIDDELGLWLEDLPASSVTILLDCCHAGTGHKEIDDEFQSRFLPCSAEVGAKSKDFPWNDLRGQLKSIGRQTCALFACQSNEQAYERRLSSGVQKESFRAGQFTHFLRMGFETGQADLNGDDRITQNEVRTFVESKLNDTFNKLRPIAADQQHPVLDSHRAEATMFFLNDN